MADLFERVEDALREKALPLVQADAGELYLVSASDAEVRVHLAGTCSGCPGAHLTEEFLLTPIVRDISPKAALVVTTGYRAPTGAKKL